MQNDNFKYIFWFIVFLTAYGMFFTVYLMIRFKGETAERFADQSMIFWLSTAVSGGIGYLIGNSMGKNSVKPMPPGSTTDTEIVTTETKKEITTTEKPAPPTNNGG